MNRKDLKYYEEIGNWDFSKIKYETEKITDWDFYEEIKKYTNENSICLDLGTGGGEKLLKRYPKAGKIIGTDFSKEMINTAKENYKKYPNRNVEFLVMDNLKMEFLPKTFDLISARHTVIDAKQIYDCLVPGGALVIEGVDKKDCWELKELFGRGQAYTDKISISEKDYIDIQKANFSKIEKIEILQNEYYKTEEDLIALLLKTPILNDFSEVKENYVGNKPIIEKELFDEYVRKNKTEKGILLKRVLYGIIAIK